ncbi:hypothetical protein U5817_06960 [Aromatoleum evansii]|uniref:Uncharacterized protein n=1 Tax=Aromatoleum evansii TaxID=59406 RepID=A0ABZ1ASE3_AROEV|nr:hypothetical protein U5817_06960 [Aromatoleum evansii]
MAIVGQFLRRADRPLEPAVEGAVNALQHQKLVAIFFASVAGFLDFSQRIAATHN